MSTSTHLGDNMQTTCLHCGSVFRIKPQQLDMARGQVRCSQCMQVFNALLTLENFGEHHEVPRPSERVSDSQYGHSRAHSEISNEIQTVSLKEAMYGDNHRNRSGVRSLLWITGILLLLIIAVVQAVYYQRYQLIASSQYQQQILNLCQILPCNESRYKSLSQIRLIERNVFTHPTRDKALMVSGSFINEASFSQPLPGLMISLSDLQGNLIANRLFRASEYLTDPSLQRLLPGKTVQFRLEIIDPGQDALTYEFEFVA